MNSPAIRTIGLSKRYGELEALAPLDLEVREGEVLGYLGPNGAGKTTTIRLLLALARPTAGRAEIFGLDAQRDAVAVHGRVDTRYRDELVERFALDPTKKVRAYSKGNRQKLSLVAALMTRADLLILDEPTSGLDPLMEHVFRQCLGE